MIFFIKYKVNYFKKFKQIPYADLVIKLMVSKDSYVNLRRTAEYFVPSRINLRDSLLWLQNNAFF